MADEPVVTGLELLRKPFPPHQISKLPKPTSKDGKPGRCDECGGWHRLPAIHLDYVGHAALTDRLLDADPAWQWEPLALDENGLPRFDKDGGLWIRLTVCGVTRLGYGNADQKSYGDAGMREKEVIGDALRNAAMRFGAALDLWHKGNLHLDEEPDTSPNRPNTATQVATDALNDMSDEMKDFLYSHAKNIQRLFDTHGNIHTYIEEQKFENEAKLGLWSLLTAPVRAEIKRQSKAAMQ